MKDYYQILGVTENSSQEDIKSAFRKLAFQHHPDTSAGDKKQAEERFKEINEAYGVLGDETKRQQYDYARNGRLAGIGQDAQYAGFEYSQQDIFRDIFTNQAMFEEMSRMFQQAGLRFDQDFLNNTYFGRSGVVFQFYTGPGGAGRRVYRYGNGTSDQAGNITTYRPNWLERLLSRIAIKIGRFMLRQLLGLQFETPPTQNLDGHMELEISPAEASAGVEKTVTYQSDGKKKKLVVKIPPGVKSGTRIRLRGAGTTENQNQGDLYLHIVTRD